MSSSVNGRGGFVTMYLKHWCDVSCCYNLRWECTYIQTLVELLLLLINYAKAEVNLVGLLERRFHTHDLGKGLFGMLQRPVAIVEDSNTIP